MCNEVETVKELCYLGDRLNACEECEAAVTPKTRLGWKKFKECGDSVQKKISLQMKEKAHI